MERRIELELIEKIYTFFRNKLIIWGKDGRSWFRIGWWFYFIKCNRTKKNRVLSTTGIVDLKHWWIQLIISSVV